MTWLKAGPFKSMYTTRHDEAPMDSAHYLMNLLPRGTEVVQRPPVRRVNDTLDSSTQIMCTGTRISGTTFQGWVLTSEPAIYQVSNDTITTMVTTANFTSAGVDGNASRYWVQFGDDIVFAEPGGKPWTWDGTAGAGGLTELTNAGNVSGTVAPVVYYGKVFFVDSADPRTIKWCEENDATTGYEAGGYNNAWTLSQSSAYPILWLEATNLGLYYFRGNSIGMIRGAVTPDFSTTGTHDEISTSIGVRTTTAPWRGAVQANNAIWFSGTPHGIYYVPISSGPEPVVLVGPEMEDAGYNEPFGFRTELEIGQDPRFTGCFATPTIGNNLKDLVIFLPNPDAALPSPLDTVSCLVVDATARRVMGWSRFYHGTGANTATGNLQGVILQSADRGIPILGDNAAGTRIFYWGKDGSSLIDSGPDENAASVLQTTVYRMIGPPIGYDAAGKTAWHFDQIRVKVFGEGSVTGECQYLTSEKSYQDEVDTAQSWTTSHDATHREARIVELGISEDGRWIRPVIAVSSATLDEFGIGDIAVDAFKQPIDEFLK